MPTSLACILLLALPSPQDTPGPPHREAAEPPALVPGQLPAQASPQAREVWRQLSSATIVPGAERQPVTAFDLTFDGRVQTRGRHDINKMRFLYKAPDWVSSQLSENNRLLRGPSGDWLIAKNEVIRLRGRESIEDRRQLDDTVNIASNFATLTDPSRMRISELVLTEPPQSLPAASASDAAGLVWVQVTSPDLRLYRTDLDRRQPSSREPSYRARLGLDPATHLPRWALVNEVRHGHDLLSTALLVRFDRYKPLDGYRVPHHIETRSLDPESHPPRFRSDYDLALWLFPGGSLHPDLTPEDFRPPR